MDQFRWILQVCGNGSYCLAASLAQSRQQGGIRAEIARKLNDPHPRIAPGHLT